MFQDLLTLKTAHVKEIEVVFVLYCEKFGAVRSDFAETVSNPNTNPLNLFAGNILELF